MSTQNILQLGSYLTVLFLIVKPLGWYMARVFTGKSSHLEQGFYRFCGINPEQEMTWKQYAFAVLAFNILGILVVYAIQRLQFWLPLNPQQLPNVSPDLALNTAISFTTNTNWQSYSGEKMMSYFTQMLALAVQNFFSAGTGIAVAVAFIRGFSRQTAEGLGNFYIDLTRTIIYILLPLSLLLAVLFMGQGVIQNFEPYKTIQTLENNTVTQTLPMGPVASQEAIKILGTNGGGFFNANSSHPFENPTPFSNFLQMLAMLLIPASLCYTFGALIGDTRQGWVLLVAMTIIFVIMAMTAIYMEQSNMEGKEVRFGTTASALFATITTATSCGAVNSMHDSFMPLGGLVPMILMQLGEVVFGGVGSGLYGILIFAILAVFIAGLMIGRTPEYLGKKIEIFEIKMAAVIILSTPFLVLFGTAIALITAAGKAGIFNPGAHGFSEVLYAFSSAANNNGSAFDGLSTNTPFYNILLSIVMWLGRFLVIIPVLAIAGSLARKKRLEVSAGTLPTHGTLFVILLMGTIILFGALTYFPALALGPIAEQLLLNKF